MSTSEKMTAYLRCIVEYHRQEGERAAEQTLLDQGVWFEGRRDADEYEQTKAWKKKRNPKEQECFLNAQQYCTEDLSARYFEGYALIATSPLPVEHAWVVMPDGAVVDFTMEAAEQVLKRENIDRDTRDTLYVGMEIPTLLIARMVIKTKGISRPLLHLFLQMRERGNATP